MRTKQDVLTNPIVGDQAGHRDKPDKRVTMRFVDAAGNECMWVTTTQFMTVKNWRRMMRGATVLKVAQP
jgi:hypothetical protein